MGCLPDAPRLPDEGCHRGRRCIAIALMTVGIHHGLVTSLGPIPWPSAGARDRASCSRFSLSLSSFPAGGRAVFETAMCHADAGRYHAFSCLQDLYYPNKHIFSVNNKLHSLSPVAAAASSDASSSPRLTKHTSPADVIHSSRCYKNGLMAQNASPNGSVLKGTSPKAPIIHAPFNHTKKSCLSSL